MQGALCFEEMINFAHLISSDRMSLRSSLLFMVVPALMLSACKSTEESAEVQAGQMLDQARDLLVKQHYTAARDTILSLRRQHPTALETRRAAILTLDSIELMETRDSLMRFETRLNACRETFAQTLPRVNGQTNQTYYDLQRQIFDMEQQFDELCAKVKFYLRKIDIDAQEL